MSHALIVGASRGLGLEFVRQYRAESWEVTATARSEQALARLRSLGARPINLDVTDQQAPARLAQATENSPCDVAAYVAGVISHGGAGSAPSREEFDRVMHINVLGAMAFIPVLARCVKPVRGKCAFITSLLGSIAVADSSATWLYRVSKAALNMAVRSAQHDYPEAVFVALSPGWVRTDMGGPGAPLTADRSVTSMRAVIASLTARDAGSFINYEGSRLAW